MRSVYEHPWMSSHRISCSREASRAGAVHIRRSFLHDRYNPDVSATVGSTSVKISRLGPRHGGHPRRRGARGRVASASSRLRRGGWTLAPAAALVALVFAATLAGPLLTRRLPAGGSLVSAAKFAEYGLLAVAVPLIVRAACRRARARRFAHGGRGRRRIRRRPADRRVGRQPRQRSRPGGVCRRSSAITTSPRWQG